MQNLVEEYFVRPILERTGYNWVNTLAYAAIAIAMLYLIWRFFKSKKFDFSGRDFLLGVSAFVLFGSTARVVTDASDAGAIASFAKAGGALSPLYSAISSSGIFDYGFLTVTPGIYLVTAALFLLSIAIGRVVGNGKFPLYAGIALWLPCLLILIPLTTHYLFFALALIIAALGAAAAVFALERMGSRKTDLREKLAIGGQALDGAATFVVIDVFSSLSGKGYFEQHVVSAGIGTATPLGFFLFFLVKIALASLIVHYLSKEKMDGGDRALVLTVVAIMGFAPGIRDLLRMLCGV